MKRVLGLDISSTTIGISVLDYDDSSISLFHQEYYKPPKKGNFINRLKETKDFIIKIIDKYKPDNIAVEDIILFMKNKSSAKTIITLAIFNRTICLAVLEHTGKLPTLLNVMKIRHCLKFDKKFPKKEEMPEIVAKHLKIKFPYYYKKSKKTKEKVIRVESEDVADSIAVALTFIKTRKEITK